MVFTLFIVCWVVLETALFSAIAILTSVFDRNGRWVHGVARVWARLILFAGRVRVRVEGLHNLDTADFYICVSNHLSNFDIPVLLAFLPIQFRWLIKKELYRIPLFGFALKRAGYVRVDRSNRAAAIKSIREEAATVVRNGVSVMVFPEGTRSQDGSLRSFKKGAFNLALESGVPILPIVLHGTYSVMPPDRIRIRPGNVILEICPPVTVSDHTMETRDALLEKVRSVILDAYEKRREQEQQC